MACKGECSKANFGLNHPVPGYFVSSQWRIPQPIYFIWRLTAAIFFVVWIILSGAIEYGWYTAPKNRVKWFIYLTNWAFLTLTVHAILDAVLVGLSLTRTRSGQPYKRMPWYYKMSWVIFNTAMPIGIVVSLAFWMLIYPYYKNCPSNEVYTACGSSATPTCSDPNPTSGTVCEERCQCPQDFPIWYDGSCIKLKDCVTDNSTQGSTAAYKKTQLEDLHFVDFGTHGGNSVYILLNLFITATPVRLQHFWHSLVFGITYITFSVIYDVSGGTNAHDQTYIYYVLDWNSKPETTLLYGFLVGFVGTLLVWLTLYGFYWIRIAIYRGCECKNYCDENLQEDDFGSRDVMLKDDFPATFGSLE